MMQAQLSYGVTQNLKVTCSAPLDVQADAHPPSSVTASAPFAGDFGLLGWYRFYRKDLNGKRVEATAMGVPLFSGRQQAVGRYRGFATGVGWIGGGVTGIASRSYYVWGGATSQRYPNVDGNQRPDLLTATAVVGYRPLSWRTDYPRWDWRIFGERAQAVREKGYTVPAAEVLVSGVPSPSTARRRSGRTANRRRWQSTS